MTEINFGSTYRIPITQAGVNKAKKAKLKELIESYPNGLIGKSKTGQARISVPDSEDNNFIAKLKAIGYKVYQKFEGDNISKADLDIYIKTRLDLREFDQKGKNPQRLPKEIKAKRRYERNYTEPYKPEVQEETVSTSTEQKIEKTEVKPKKEPLRFPKAEIKPPYDRKARIRESKSYIEIKDKYGEEFAEAVFFGIKE